MSDKAPHCLDNRPVNGYRGAQTGWTALAPANKGGRYAGRTGHAAAEVWCEGRGGRQQVPAAAALMTGWYRR